MLLSSIGRPTADLLSLSRSSTCLNVSAVPEPVDVDLAPGLVDSWHRNKESGYTFGTDTRPATTVSCSSFKFLLIALDLLLDGVNVLHEYLDSTLSRWRTVVILSWGRSGINKCLR
ncbi:hypothetical protein E2C01_016364 [Portunus trituberculatus]|uniref:Uncharacterized protein n=1 Tax=Portunus trituberculatus TaxID=210409 RepID=A0A5B7DP74_PORTR|nr:hypothetical protein [Portunus trituberculatus]